jgi:hypothetical protein
MIRDATQRWWMEVEAQCRCLEDAPNVLMPERRDLEMGHEAHPCRCRRSRSPCATWCASSCRQRQQSFCWPPSSRRGLWKREPWRRASSQRRLWEAFWKSWEIGRDKSRMFEVGWMDWSGMPDVVVELIDEERRGRKEERWERNARLLNASEYRAKGFTALRSQHQSRRGISQSPLVAYRHDVLVGARKRERLRPDRV